MQTNLVIINSISSEINEASDFSADDILSERVWKVFPEWKRTGKLSSRGLFEQSASIGS